MKINPTRIGLLRNCECCVFDLKFSNALFETSVGRHIQFINMAGYYMTYLQCRSRPILDCTLSSINKHDAYFAIRY